MNKLKAIILCAATFQLGMLIAYYDAVILRDPPIHYEIESRYLNYTQKDCFTQSDVELIVFGEVLQHQIDCENCDEID